MKFKIILISAVIAVCECISTSDQLKSSRYQSIKPVEEPDQSGTPTQVSNSYENHPKSSSSGEAISTQSFVRHDIPLSYKMVSTHPKQDVTFLKPVPPKHVNFVTQTPQHLNNYYYFNGASTAKYNEASSTEASVEHTTSAPAKDSYVYPQHEDKTYTPSTQHSQAYTQQNGQQYIVKPSVQYYRPNSYTNENYYHSGNQQLKAPENYFLPTAAPQTVYQYHPTPKYNYNQVPQQLYTVPQANFQQQYAYTKPQQATVPFIIKYVTAKGQHENNAYTKTPEQLYYVLPSNTNYDNYKNNQNIKYYSRDQQENGSALGKPSYQSALHSYQLSQGFHHLPSPSLSSPLFDASVNQAKAHYLTHPPLSGQPSPPAILYHKAKSGSQYH